jgi:lysophospholipase L1-like esterase
LLLAGLLHIPYALKTEGQENPPVIDPKRWEKAIQAFEAEDGMSPPPKGAIVGIGSSSMRLWHHTIQKDLSPLTIIPRGFGGSTMADARYYADRIVIPYKPRAVILYEGDNDIGRFNLPPEQILEIFNGFVEKIHGSLPQTRIYVISIKPSIARWNFWPQMEEANRLLKKACASNALLTYIDVASPLLDSSNTPRKDIFLKDNLHLNEKGYQIWTDTIRSVLIPGEGQYENL